MFDSSIHCLVYSHSHPPHYRLDILNLDLAVRRSERVDFERVASEVDQKICYIYLRLHAAITSLTLEMMSDIFQSRTVAAAETISLKTMPD